MLQTGLSPATSHEQTVEENTGEVGLAQASSHQPDFEEEIDKLRGLIDDVEGRYINAREHFAQVMQEDAKATFDYLNVFQRLWQFIDDDAKRVVYPAIVPAVRQAHEAKIQTWEKDFHEGMQEMKTTLAKYHGCQEIADPHEAAMTALEQADAQARKEMIEAFDQSMRGIKADLEGAQRSENQAAIEQMTSRIRKREEAMTARMGAREHETSARMAVLHAKLMEALGTGGCLGGESE